VFALATLVMLLSIVVATRVRPGREPADGG